MARRRYSSLVEDSNAVTSSNAALKRKGRRKRCLRRAALQSGYLRHEARLTAGVFVELHYRRGTSGARSALTAGVFIELHYSFGYRARPALIAGTVPKKPLIVQAHFGQSVPRHLSLQRYCRPWGSDGVRGVHIPNPFGITHGTQAKTRLPVA